MYGFLKLDITQPHPRRARSAGSRRRPQGERRTAAERQPQAGHRGRRQLRAYRRASRSSSPSNRRGCVATRRGALLAGYGAGGAAAGRCRSAPAQRTPRARTGGVRADARGAGVDSGSGGRASPVRAPARGRSTPAARAEAELLRECADWREPARAGRQGLSVERRHPGWRVFLHPLAVSVHEELLKYAKVSGASASGDYYRAGDAGGSTAAVSSRISCLRFTRFAGEVRQRGGGARLRGERAGSIRRAMRSACGRCACTSASRAPRAPTATIRWRSRCAPRRCGATSFPGTRDRCSSRRWPPRAST